MKKKLKLDQLDVQSFVTDLGAENSKELYGASGRLTCEIGCTDVTGFYNCASYVGECATVYMPSIKEYCTIHFNCKDVTTVATDIQVRTL